MLIAFKNDVYDLSISGLRRSLHTEVNDTFSELDGEEQDEYQEELETIHTLISEKNASKLEEGFWFNGEAVFSLTEAQEYLEISLKEAGYQVEVSNISRSVYVLNDQQEEMRIADHKRPAFEVNGSYESHEYAKEIIVSNNKVSSNCLRDNGLTKLEKHRTYFLG